MGVVWVPSWKKCYNNHKNLSRKFIKSKKLEKSLLSIKNAVNNLTKTNQRHHEACIKQVPDLYLNCRNDIFYTD